MSRRLLSLQLLLAFAVANARNDPPPSSDRAWSPPGLPNYERDLANYPSNDRKAALAFRSIPEKSTTSQS